MRSRLLVAVGCLVLLSIAIFLGYRQDLVSLPAASAEACSKVYETLCAAGIGAKDPTGEMGVDGESRARALRRELSIKSPKMTPVELREDLARTIYTPKRVEELQSAFRWVKSAIVNLIEGQADSVFSRREKKWLKARLDKIRLELPPPAAIYSDEPELLVQDEVHYERDIGARFRLRVGGGYAISAKSRFNLIFTMAHELAHSIDPCEVRSANMSIPAYSRLTGCFLKKAWIDPRPTRSECGANDQLSETFADWMAVQITAEALRAFAKDSHGVVLLAAAANSIRDLCEPEGESEDGSVLMPDTEHHPEPRLRIEQIFGRNPAIRSVLGCEPEPVAPQRAEYCRF